jgi:hypothetical protein
MSDMSKERRSEWIMGWENGGGGGGGEAGRRFGSGEMLMQV